MRIQHDVESLHIYQRNNNILYLIKHEGPWERTQCASMGQLVQSTKETLDFQN